MLLLFAACQLEPSLVELEAGHFVHAAEDTGGGEGVAMTAVLSLDGPPTLVLGDGTDELTFTLDDEWDQADWPTGCPTQAPAMAMETRSLDPATFDLGALHYTDAAVYARCPAGNGLTIAEADDIRGKGEGEKCAADTCVSFDP